MSLLDSLNNQQREAAACTEGPLLILAGAGSGKTRTIIHRIAYILEQKLAWPSEILAITFTNKAAGEMRERIAAMHVADSKSIWMSTFHAACARILRMQCEHLGYGRNFVIYDTDDQKRLYKTIVKDLQLSDKLFSFNIVIGAISDAKNRDVDAETFAREAAGDFRQEKIAEAYKLYQSTLKKNNAMDFDDLIFNTLKLFRENEAVLDYYRRKFKYILVDEYQDTNHSQYELVNMLAGHYRNLCVCGDDDQSIYGWRGADINNILDFEKDYPDAKVVKLEENYRSTPVILDAANHVIANNRGRKEKALWTANPEGAKVLVSSYDTGNAEAADIGARIRNLCLEKGYTFGDMAVLYRTNAQSRLFEEAFMREGIPYQIVGGIGFYARQEIKDIITYLHVLVNPDDDLGTARIINVPKRGIGGSTVTKMADFAEFKGWSLMEAAYRYDEIVTLSASVKAKVKEFADTMNSLRQKAEAEPVSQVIKAVMAETGYMDMLEEGKLDHSESRIDNLNELVTSAVEFEKNSDDTSLTAFLETVALTSQTDAYNEDEGRVLLMTLHNAKGLEFPVVFMPGMEDGIFPHFRSLESESEIEEERRICYVGITRAEKQLFMSWAASRTNYGRVTPQIRSRFLDELPEACIEVNDQTVRHTISRAPKIKERGSELFSENINFGRRRPRKKASASANASAGFKAGDKVKHKKFGVGTIVEVKPNQVSIAFPGLGIKKLDPGYVSAV
ncbi:MAG: DNA helicase PcrA [Eubacteriaceae bacterium]|nr:DNA helicase PcrA [Eubacteriaceae bacterium]